MPNVSCVIRREPHKRLSPVAVRALAAALEIESEMVVTDSLFACAILANGWGARVVDAKKRHTNPLCRI